ncbi:DUF6249 domain-containing protein [Brevundimonas sp. GCM10030266]|uniref:DUF6249 domain-containing protein n=1 Tax=Brevundimonas sp. GCM10030266 TaxID=3273386 RepID=UPI0036129EC7
MEWGLLVPLSPFIMIIAVVGFQTWQKIKAQKEMQQTLRAAIDKGQPLPTDVIESMSASIHRPPSANRDMRLGVILLAVSAGVALCGAAFSYFAEEALYAFLAFAAIPATVGVAFLGLSAFNKNKD